MAKELVIPVATCRTLSNCKAHIDRYCASMRDLDHEKDCRLDAFGSFGSNFRSEGGASPAMTGPNYSTSIPSPNGRFGLEDTPTMRARKHEQAVALRLEANNLLKQDGGNLTPAHKAYIRRRSCEILGNPPAPTGTMVPRRRCI